MDKERKGIGDLMEKHRYRPSHLQQSLVEKEIPGRWEGKNGLQNVYNLINGNVVPRDAYVFVFLAKFLEVSLTEILMRFTTKSQGKKHYQGDTINW
jgi:hypothetical protein